MPTGPNLFVNYIISCANKIISSVFFTILSEGTNKSRLVASDTRTTHSHTKF